MISPATFSIREILEVTLLIVARYIPEKIQQESKQN